MGRSNMEEGNVKKDRIGKSNVGRDNKVGVWLVLRILWGFNQILRFTLIS